MDRRVPLGDGWKEKMSVNVEFVLFDRLQEVFICGANHRVDVHPISCHKTCSLQFSHEPVNPGSIFPNHVAPTLLDQRTEFTLWRSLCRQHGAPVGVTRVLSFSIVELCIEGTCTGR